MAQTISVAIAHFPDRGHAIEGLARRDEDFRALCSDLAEADAALAQWQHSSSPVKQARCAEYRDLVRYLVAELEAILDLNR
ncbi:hypothetical protein FQV39_04700 [Bosea sp. F3-2]|uniref:hypothetical protein n=1 Tax=Bosea sp. F3-2 TaxID=2599640 RepID=UPI0011EE8067|nr:hypothetical protein [Bosea sp. F3-2]QEL21954.1 hypothetical protein FQV39_04700 [Bosea sp. F3-2]